MLFSVGQEYWLKGTESRANMRVVVVASQLDANGDWTYQLKDNESQLIEGGKYFPEDDLSNNQD